MTRSLTLSLSVFALAAGAALAQQSDTQPESGGESGADIAAETRELLQGSQDGQAQQEAPTPQEAPAEPPAQAPAQTPANSQPAPTAGSGAPSGSAAQPETLRMLQQSGAQPVEAQREAAQPAPQGSAPATASTAPSTERGESGDAAQMQATTPNVPPTPEQIEAATYAGGALPDGQSAITVKTQILLDRAHVSPGVIDGWKGGMSESAIAAFETREGFAVDGQLDQQVWEALTAGATGPMLQSYTITEPDMQGLSAPLPEDYAKLAELDRLGHTSVAERLAERFHMDQGFLESLNAGVSWQAGSTITVADPGPRQQARVVRIEVRKPSSRLAGFDESGRMVVNYPVTIGSDQTPSPSGTVEVTAVAMEPTYTYNPDVNFQQGDNDEVLILPPGPNGPVGSVWIDLSKPTYGLHGTSDPDSLFKSASHGCVRLSNWDVEELAQLVSEGVSVEFVE